MNITLMMKINTKMRYYCHFENGIILRDIENNKLNDLLCICFYDKVVYVYGSYLIIDRRVLCKY